MKQIFAPISKINKKTREVHGILANEIKDKDGEIMDYFDSKPLFEKWSNGIKKVSGGKSVGNLREMHQPIVAGKFTSMVFNDELKQIEVISKVSNDRTWKRVLEGELNGFSIYGNPVYRKRDSVNKAIRYAVQPLEGSLVDNPCMYGADFTLIKEDGVEIVAKFAGEKKPYQFWHCLHNCDLLHRSEEEAVGCLGVVAKSYQDEEQDQEGNEDPVKKSMYDVSSLASNISSLQWINPGEENKKKFGAAVRSLFSVLSGMVNVEKEKFQESLNALETNALAVKSIGLTLIEGDTMKAKVVKKAVASENEENDEIEEIEFDETSLVNTIRKAVGKDVAKAVGTVLEENFADIREDIQVLSEAVQGLSGLPRKSKTVVKMADRRKLNDDVAEPDKKVKKVEKIEKTSNPEELIEVMKAALKRPINQVEIDGPDDEDDEEGDESVAE